MLAYLFIVLAFASRFLPHPWHFTPVGAALLFFGARATRRQMWFPVALLAVSDVILSKYVYGMGLDLGVLVSWAWYAGIVLLGTRLRDTSNPLWIGSSAVASAFSFFVVSNFAVWVGSAMYARTMAGLMTCYAAGIPFFKHDAAGTLLFTAVMFSLPALAKLPKGVRGSGPATI
ncbi:MAG TPA: DUF6580 family putative transport protein [Terriglobales bacterium]